MRKGVVARVAGALALFLCGFAFVQPARADLAITVDKSTQRLTVVRDGEQLYVWPVSTGIAGHDTPSGTFKPFRMEKDHFSKEWDDAPMPNSVFFTMRGHAIHGSSHLKAMGTPASHGCVRLEPKNAEILFNLVKQETMARTSIAITGEIPEAAPLVSQRQNPQIATAPVAAAPSAAPAPAPNSFARLFSNDGPDARPYENAPQYVRPQYDRPYDRQYDRRSDRDDVTGSVPPPPGIRLRPGERLVREYSRGNTTYYRIVPAPRRYGYDDRPPYPYYGR